MSTVGALTPITRWVVLNNGVVAPGAKLYTYLSGTSTPHSVYSDPDLAIGHALSNPVVADSEGVLPVIYLDAVTYRFLITDANGTTIFPAQDHISDLGQLLEYTTQTANTFFAGPSSGSAAAPTFRALVAADLPSSSNNGTAHGRLTLTTGTPVTVTDVTAATTVYYAPYAGNSIALYDGSSAWNLRTFTQLSVAVPGTTNTNYDVFAYDNSGTVTLELVAWTNATTRATALTTQDGVLVKSGATTRRYLGSFRTTAVSGQCEDSLAKRFVWNYTNRVQRPLRVNEATDSWAYTLAAYRQANASAANQVEALVGWAEVTIQVRVQAYVANSTNNVATFVAIGEDSASVPVTGGSPGQYASTNGGGITGIFASVEKFPAVGYHYYAWLERSVATGTTTWYGDNGDATLLQSGIVGVIWG